MYVEQGNHSQRIHDHLRAKAINWLEKHKTRGFFSMCEDPSFEGASQSLMQISGLGKLKPNLLLMGYKGDWNSCHREELRGYFNVIQ